MSSQSPLPENLLSLHGQEENLRRKAITLINEDERLRLHLEIVEQAMNLTDLLRQIKSDDEDFKVIKFLCMRIFNAFGASLKLTLSGYHQNSTMIMSDIIETVFLLDYFQSRPSSIKEWRFADEKTKRDKFSPVKIRIALDKRDGLNKKRREEKYKLFSKLAGHPSMESINMMRPIKGGDAVSGPFVEKAAVEAVLSEMGQLALQAGIISNRLFPRIEDFPDERLAFIQKEDQWIGEFYTDLKK
jgi:hypothetical protein